LKPRERVLAALRGEEPDRVPLFEIEINKPIARQILGHPVGDDQEYYSVYSGLGLDGINVWDSGYPLKTVDENRYIDNWGIIWQWSPESETNFYVGGTIQGPEDMQRIEVPNRLRTGRLRGWRRSSRGTGRSLLSSAGSTTPSSSPLR